MAVRKFFIGADCALLCRFFVLARIITGTVYSICVQARICPLGEGNNNCYSRCWLFAAVAEVQPFLPLTPTPQFCPTPDKTMKGDLQESFRHGEDAPIAFMDVEAHLFNMTKTQCSMWDEEGHEAGAISEMATEAVWRRISSNVIPHPMVVLPERRPPTTHVTPNHAPIEPLRTTLPPATCIPRPVTNAKIFSQPEPY